MALHFDAWKDVYVIKIPELYQFLNHISGVLLILCDIFFLFLSILFT